VPLLAHVGEQRGDVELIKKTFQKNILAVLQDFTAFRPDTVFVHLNHLSSQETQSLAEVEASVVICARSAAFKRTGYPALRHSHEAVFVLPLARIGEERTCWRN